MYKPATHILVKFAENWPRNEAAYSDRVKVQKQVKLLVIQYGSILHRKIKAIYHLQDLKPSHL